MNWLSFCKKSHFGQKQHPTNVMAHLQQTQREALLYFPFYWVADNPRWLLISPQELLGPVFAVSNYKTLPLRCRSLNTHTVSVFIRPSVVVQDVFQNSFTRVKCIHNNLTLKDTVEAKWRLWSCQKQSWKSGINRGSEWRKRGGQHRMSREKSAHDDMLHYTIPGGLAPLNHNHLPLGGARL